MNAVVGTSFVHDFHASSGEQVTEENADKRRKNDARDSEAYWIVVFIYITQSRPNNNGDRAGYAKKLDDELISETFAQQFHEYRTQHGEQEVGQEKQRQS